MLQYKLNKMKNLILLILVFLASNVYSQTTYNSSVTTRYKSEGEIIKKPRTITVSNSEITISNFIGGTKPLNLIVNEIKEKEDDWDGLMIWYYCTSTDQDVISGKKSEFIIKMKKSNSTELEVYQKVDDVTFIKTLLSLR